MRWSKSSKMLSCQLRTFSGSISNIEAASKGNTIIYMRPIPVMPIGNLSSQCRHAYLGEVHCQLLYVRIVATNEWC